MTESDRVRVRVFGAPAGEAARVAAAWPDAEILHGPSDGEVAAALVWDCDPGELAAFLDAQPALAWLHTTAAGLPPEVLSRLAGRAGLTATNGADTHGPAVAEHVLALVLAHCKRLPQLLDAQRAGRWQPPAARELRALRAGIVGLGDLGRATARLLGAFGAEVVGLRRGEGAVAEVSATYRPDQLDAFCQGLDLLIVAAPLTEATRGLIGRRQLARLRPGAFLVNVGRGPIVVEEALLDALRSGQLAGAGLDVFD
ncbi:MAG TPA: NAD(P)-dependent oxidoreductase, partial [Streptomyces sp.]|nr:NAD(P)-dependent oxidoreductase [Streptomyces sp.]